MTDKTQGLIDKFTVRRHNDPAHKHDDCRYFVLDPQHDPLALSALAMYAAIARLSGYTALADDLKAWVQQIEDTETKD